MPLSTHLGMFIFTVFAKSGCAIWEHFRLVGLVNLLFYKISIKLLDF